MHLLEISIFSLNNDLVKLTKIMNKLVRDFKIMSSKVTFQCLKLVESFKKNSMKNIGQETNSFLKVLFQNLDFWSTVRPWNTEPEMHGPCRCRFLNWVQKILRWMNLWSEILRNTVFWSSRLHPFSKSAQILSCTSFFPSPKSVYLKAFFCFLKMCQIFVGYVHNFSRSDSDIT